MPGVLHQHKAALLGAWDPLSLHPALPCQLQGGQGKVSGENQVPRIDPGLEQKMSKMNLAHLVIQKEMQLSETTRVLVTGLKGQLEEALIGMGQWNGPI